MLVPECRSPPVVPWNETMTPPACVMPVATGAAIFRYSSEVDAVPCQYTSMGAVGLAGFGPTSILMPAKPMNVMVSFCQVGQSAVIIGMVGFHFGVCVT